MHDRYEIHIVKTSNTSVEWTILIGDYGSEDHGNSTLKKGVNQTVEDALLDVSAWLSVMADA